MEVKTIWVDDEASKMLSDGWELLHGGVAHRDEMGYQLKTCYVMGRVKNVSKKRATK